MKEENKPDKEYIKNFAKLNTDLSILEFFLYIMRKRLIIFCVSVIMILLLASAYFYNFYKQPTFHSSSLGFTLNFDGLKQHKYPNGSPFLQNDIISTMVLFKVYKQNDLNVYFNSFENFKTSISIFRNASELEFNRFEFTSKLSNQELKASERTEIEQKFYSKRDEILSKTNFKLVCSYANSKYTIPDVVINKSLNNILTTWLDIAKRQKGAFTYDLPLLTSKLLQKKIDHMDYFISLDLLRRLILKIQVSVDRLNNLPNCSQITISVNDQQYTLEDISFELNYILNYELFPLLQKVIQAGICKNSEDINNYLNQMLYSVKEKLNLVNAEKNFFTAMYQENILGTPKDIVNKSLDSFRLTEEEQFYEKVNQTFSLALRDSTKPAKLINDFNEKQNRIKESILLINSLTNDFLKKISTYDLDPGSKYYNIVSFSSYSTHLFNKKSILIVFAAVFVALEALIFAALYIKFVLYKKGGQ